MNLLQIQDALKGASDQQLIQEMQRPSGAVPQYLVLSELDRRKNMRAQVQGQTPDTTIAEDTVAGIASLAPHRMIDPDVEEQRQDEDGISAFREGGVVYMQGGGDVPLSREEMSRRMFRPNAFTSSTSPIEVARREREIMLRANPALANDPSFTANLADQYGISPEDLGAPTPPARFITPPPEMPPVLNQAAVAPPVPGMTPNYGESDTAPGTVPNPFAGGAPNAAPQGTQAPGARGTSNPPGGGGGRAAAAPGGAAATGGAPTWEGIRDRVIGDTPDQLRAMAEEIRRGRPNSEERRNEALNMALIEAGLRIAGSQSPHFAQALSEGAVPAVQGYTRAVGDIRKEAREATKDELEVRMAQITNMYRAGQISASLYNTQLDSLDKAYDRASRERTAGMTASEAARDRAERAAADREARRDIARGQQESDVLRSLEHRIKQDRESINATGFRLLNAAQQKEIRDRLAVDEANYNRIVNARVAAIPGAVRSLEELRASVR